MSGLPDSARHPVVRLRLDSSLIAEALYDENVRTLDVHYQDGKAYRHYEVDVSTWAALITAASPGRYFLDFIRERHTRSRIPDAKPGK